MFLYPVILVMIGSEPELHIEVSGQVAPQSDHEDHYVYSGRSSTSMTHSSHSSTKSSLRATLKSCNFARKEHRRDQNDISLSTIAEERDTIKKSQSSHERIVVEPHFVVETITTSSPASIPTAQQQIHHLRHFQPQFVIPTTKVKTTAKLKLQLQGIR